MFLRRPLSFILIQIALLIFAVKNLEGDTLFRNERPSTPLSEGLAHYMMGIIYDNDGKFSQAADEYKKALAVEPDISYLHTRLAADYLFTKQEDNAIKELEAAKSLNPDDSKPRFLLGLIYTAKNRLDDARKEYEEVVRSRPDSIWALVSLADVLVLQDKMNEAAGVYEKLLEGRKDSAPLHFNLAIIYAKTGKTEAAIEHLKEVLRLEADGKEPRVLSAIHFYLGTLYESIKKKDLAISELREAIRLDNRNADACNYLGYMFADEGVNLDEAISLIEKALAIEPDNGAYLDSLGWAYYKKGMFDEAFKQLEKAVRLAPDEDVIKEHFEKVKDKLKK